jgi:hypothetical protein
VAQDRGLSRRHKISKRPEGLTASEALAQFDDLPDGAALAAAADSLGLEYGDFIDRLAAEQEKPKT